MITINRSLFRSAAAILLLFTTPMIFAQADPAEAGADSTESTAESVDSASAANVGDGAIAAEGLQPVYPASQPGLIYIEAEDAVSTNFANQATLDYASSGQRMLQLNSSTAAPGGQTFYAEYVFLVETAGEYEFYISGTPPGPGDPVFPSYVSPFRYTLDDNAARSVYREDVAVISQFGVVNYWYVINSMQLEPGIHTLRIEVPEQREFDGKYYLFLDSLFLLDRSVELEPALLPTRFPADLDSRNINRPYRTISEYEYLIGQDATNTALYISLAQVYSLLGDYLNALKYLNRGLAYAPENRQLLLLIAKNRIWKGDVVEGLNAFDRYLAVYPDDLAVIAEAAKIAAWTGRYNQSIRLYEKGLAIDPDNFNLKVNLGLTYLWNSNVEPGLEQIQDTTRRALAEPSLIEPLAEVFSSNSYAGYSVDLLEQALRRYPDHVAFYLDLSAAYQANGQQEEADEIMETLTESFGDDPGLEQYLQRYDLKNSLKQNVIENFRALIRETPDDLVLREQLVQTLFWNGQKQEAVNEYLAVMGNSLLTELRELEGRSSDLLLLMDQHYVIKNYLDDVYPTIQAFRRKLLAEATEYRNITKELSSLQAEQAKIEADETKNDNQIARLAELPGLIADAQNRQQDAIMAYSETADDSREYLRRIELARQWYASAEAALQSVRDAAAEEQERLASLTTSNGWQWDRESTYAELAHIAETGNALGSYLSSNLDRSLTRGSDTLAAAAVMLDEELPAFADATRLATEFRLWSGQINAISLDNYYGGAAGEVNALSVRLYESYVPLGLGDPAELAEDQVKALDAELAAVVTPVRTLQTEIDGRIAELQSLLDLRFSFAMYLYESGTYTSRYQLGEYYLDLGDYEEASRQFSTVLRVDPFNSNAIFRLASVQQLWGDWSRAMKGYRQVYQADPGFENVRQLYNQLARANATNVSLSAMSLADSSRWTNIASIIVNSPVTTLMSLEGTYQISDIRLHKPASGEDAETISLNTVRLGLPLNLRGIGTTLTASAGASVNNRMYSDEYADIPSPVLPENIFSAFAVAPEFGGELAVSAGHWSYRGAYRWYQLEDSFFSTRDPYRAHAFEADVGSYYDYPQITAINSFGTRSYASLKFVQFDDVFGGGQGASAPGSPSDTSADDNIMYSFVQDLVLSTHILDSPWTNVTYSMTLSYENAVASGLSDYYAPDSVFLAKVGVAGATWLGGLPNQRVMGLAPRIALGYYGSGLGGGSSAHAFYFDGAMRVDQTQGTGTGYLELGGSGALGSDGLSYFSMYLTVGLSSNFPSLLE